MKLPYWRLSGFYFFYFATLGAFLPFWSLYLKQVGFAANEIGELTALMIATKIIAPNLWGYVADKAGKRLWLIRLAIGLSALLFAGFFLWQRLLLVCHRHPQFQFFLERHLAAI